MSSSFKIIAISFLMLIVIHTAQPISVAEDLIEALSSDPASTANIVVRLHARTSNVLESLTAKTFQTRADRATAVFQGLRRFTSDAQKPIVDFLKSAPASKPPVSFHALWITNVILVRNADLSLVARLAAFPEVESISREQVFEIDTEVVQVIDAEDDETESKVPWGIDHIRAPSAWAQGVTGENVVVAVVDTGVHGSHKALQTNYLGGRYGWFDPWNSTAPFDNVGHGTHVVGTILGRMNNIGVAPGAKWAACKGCIGGLCFQLDLYLCGQWVACPSYPYEDAEGCPALFHVVSNSWGGGRGNTWYYETVEAQKAMGIVPFFSQGNAGPECGTASSPGDYDNLIGVGATNVDNQVAWFSSVGPTAQGGRIKPDVVAPGENITSAYNSADNSYAVISGTSMACPHAAGVAALVLSKYPNLSYEQVKYALAAGSVDVIETTGRDCGGVSEGVYPNNHVGNGRIDAVGALKVASTL